MNIISSNGEIEVCEGAYVYYEDRIEHRAAFLDWAHRPEGVDKLIQKVREKEEEIIELFKTLLPEPGQQLTIDERSGRDDVRGRVTL